MSSAPHGSVAAVLDDVTVAAVETLMAEAGGPAWDEAGFARLRGHVAGNLAGRPSPARSTWSCGSSTPRARWRRGSSR